MTVVRALLPLASLLVGCAPHRDVPVTEAQPSPAPAAIIPDDTPPASVPRAASPGRTTLTARQVRAVLDPLKPDLAGCNQHLWAGQRVRVPVTLTIEGSTGKLLRAHAVGDDEDTPLGRCVAGKVQGVRFPTFEQSTMRAQYPFELERTH